MANDKCAGRLAGKVALVTGAAPGLGGVIAEAMGREGARLVLCDIDDSALDRTRARPHRAARGIRIAGGVFGVGQVISPNGGGVI